MIKRLLNKVFEVDKIESQVSALGKIASSLRKENDELRATLDNPSASMFGMTGDFNSDSGVKVSPQSALRLAAVFACVQIRAETIGSIPLHVYRRDGSRKAIDRSHPLYPILHNEPYPEYGLSSNVWREILQAWVDLYGNGYALIHRLGSGRVRGLQPWHPDFMRVVVKNGMVSYFLQTASGEKEWPEKDIFHLKSTVLGSDAVVGKSRIGFARESIGGALASDKFAHKFYKNNGRPGGYIEYPGKLSQVGVDNLKADWMNRAGGLDNAHKTGALLEGGKYVALAVPQNDAQFIETRRFSVEEIARIFNVPPHKIQDLARATNNNIEEQSIGFVQDTVRTIAVRWEAEIERQLFDESERGEFFAEFVLDGLLRGNTKSRNESYTAGRMGGWLSVNDIRDKENMNPIDGGDAYLTPLNMAPVGGEQPQPDNDADASTRGAPHARAGECSCGCGKPHENPEKRETREVKGQERLTARNAFRPVMIDAANRLSRAEIREVRKAVNQHLKRDAATFSVWLDRFYGTEFTEMVIRLMGPTLDAYSSEIQRIASAEIDFTGDTDVLNQLRNDYTLNFAERHGSSSNGQLNQLLNTPGEVDEIEAIEQRLDEWEDTRGQRDGNNETIRLAEAMAMGVFALGGVVLYRWQSNADACPLCEEIDGKIVGREQNFVDKGGTVDPDDGKTVPLQSSGNIGHAPLHLGCVCQVVPD